MSWQDVQDAMSAAVAAAARLDPSRVIWAWQDIDQPPDPYIKLAMPTILQVGQDWVAQIYSAARAPGQEFKLQPQGTREVPLEVQGFTDSTADGNAANFMLEQMKGGLLLPSARNLLTAVGVGLFDPGPVQFSPEVVAAGYRGRATCTLRCYAPAQALAEYVGYILTVNGTITTTGGAFVAPTVIPWSGKIGT